MPASGSGGAGPVATARRPARPDRRRGAAVRRPPAPAAPSVGGARYSVYFTGIGGTGVVTATRIMAAAAEAAGLVVGGLDQTGLSQKAGAVVSHLHLAARPGGRGLAAASASPAPICTCRATSCRRRAERHLDGWTRAGPSRWWTATSHPPPAMLQTRLGRARRRRSWSGRSPSAVGSDRAVFVDAKRIAESVVRRITCWPTCPGRRGVPAGRPAGHARRHRAGHRPAGQGRRRQPRRVRVGPLGRARPGRRRDGPRRERDHRAGAASVFDPSASALSTRAPTAASGLTAARGLTRRDVPAELPRPARPAHRPGDRLPGHPAGRGASSTWCGGRRPRRRRRPRLGADPGGRRVAGSSC